MSSGSKRDAQAHVLQLSGDTHRRRDSAINLKCATAGRFTEDTAGKRRARRRPVLVIEDNPGDATLIRVLLSEVDPHYDVTRVARLATALELVERQNFEFIMADLSLPDSKGVATVTRLLSACAASTPVIILTGQADENVAAQAVKVGAQDYLMKGTLDPDALKRSLRYALERHRAHLDLHRLLRINPDGVLVLASDGTILFGNPSAAAMLDSTPDALVGQRFCERIENEGEAEITLPSGAWVEIRAVATDWEGRKAFVVALRDITERRRTESKLAYLAHYDQLTGLANRTLFRERLNRSIIRANRHGRGFALLTLDLDRFKWVNDTLGHDAGDSLLVEVAARLRNATREADTVARLGGDEFALIADNVESTADATTVAEKIIDAFQLPFLLGTKMLNVTTSVGIAMYPRDAETEAKLLVGADAAMYRAKKKGRNQFCFFDHTSHEVAVDRVRLQSDLRHALAAGEFEVHYQPVYGDRRLVAVEALLRWQHPLRGTIMPTTFVPWLEQAGLITEVGEWVLNTACRQVASWRDHCPGLRVAVNVSPRQLISDDFVTTVSGALRDHELDPDALELEITESMLMSEHGRTAAVLESLHELGVRIALDDFGTGYSSLAHLSNLPAISAIKIDKSFVAGIGQDRRETVIVTAIAGLAANLGLEVIAEGVETLEQHAFLKQQGCNAFQGFLLGTPRCAADWGASGPDAAEPHVAPGNHPRASHAGAGEDGRPVPEAIHPEQSA